MKKLSLTILTALLLLALAWTPCQAEGTIINACYQKNNGQMRIVTDPCECLPSENAISWTSGVSQDVSSITIFVNTLTGEDSPDKGLSIDQPFKTISYALERVPSLRLTADVGALLMIAPGTYSEAVAIDLKNIWMMGSGIGSTEIVGPAGSNAISINGQTKVGVSGLTVLNGETGIWAVGGSSVRVEDVSVQDTNADGMMAASCAVLSLLNCTVTGSGGNGIGAYGSSQILFSGNIISSSNYSAGIHINGSSHSTAMGAMITTTENDFGILINSSASSNFQYSKVTADNNDRDGIHIIFGSSLALHGGICTTSNNKRIGVLIGDSCINNYGNMLIENNESHGMAVINQGYISLPNLALGIPFGTLIIRNNASRGLWARDGVVGFFNGNANVTGHGIDVDLQFGSKATFYNGNTIGSISCDGTALISGEEVCP